ncbi:tRNA (cytidine(34)-2'-O)-methyltransferase [Arsenicitalea aurantiaca]|uniref:tRNA (cytidine(34)-2'-O)-methyltransferase n=1 Tax=Arsenicitalea aurantiaca TaxID=1783274 RepID=A0A433XLI8_9HYPH|nr:TrmH family RNA methyltransferase [Arsenicitalea aurantiaca]RUT34952.1 tRNA (cytidine(34)-2'-O)-methyltransferase [Arsenicitalea aurantiaca]
MPLALALYQPDIAQNTGTLLRLGACMGIEVHVIHPTGFPFSRQALRRSGLDYLDHVALVEHVSFARFSDWCEAEGRRLVLLTTRAETSAYAFSYAPADVLMVGRESAGVPDDVAARADARIRIPMRSDLRSINVALAAAMVVGEAGRQTDLFQGLS